MRSVITAGAAVTETHYVGQHYETTLNSGDTKYYFIAGQFVAFERSSGYGVDWGRRFVFRDHPSTALRTGLGSTNVIINAASGLLLWRDRYLPLGDVRDTYRKDNNPSFSLQTQYRFTGQRLESRLGTPESGLDRGLYFYGARWYDSSLGRFIQADTIVPQPGNPQALNRYSYVLNNALRYTDPTGMFSEDEIMKYYGVKTWEEVLALYEKGGRLEGLWGWLETLRQAELGDRVTIWDRECQDPRCKSIEGGIYAFFDGIFAEKDGQLVVEPGWSRPVTFSADAVALISRSHYGISTRSFFTAPQQKHVYLRTKPTSAVDWVGAGLDAGGIVADVLTYGTGGRLINGIQVAVAAGKAGAALDVASIWYDAISAATAVRHGDRRAFRSGAIDVGLDVLGAGVPILFDVASLGRTFFHIGP